MSKFKIGDKVMLRRDRWWSNEGANNPINTVGEVVHVDSHSLQIVVNWSNGGSSCYNEVDLKPSPFTINKGDYIDSREFTREECERFCEIAVECGHDRGEWMDHYDSFCRRSNINLLSVRDNALFWSYIGKLRGFDNNITTKFREFLDKEKGMSKFTKDDLKDGMRCIDYDGDTWYVCGDFLSHKGGHTTNDVFEGVSKWDEDFKHKSAHCDIMKVIDRDNTVMWERQEEPLELTIEEIAKAFNLPPERVRIKK